VRGWLRKRPWIWLVILYLAVMAVHAAFVWIAERNPVIPADGAPPLPPG
jgi:hypothetical protein